MTGVLDLFAGPGGWDVAARDLGLDALGVEVDRDARNTRTAAGLRTVRADVAACDPANFGTVDLLIASPPCGTYSGAGKGAGRSELQITLDRISHGTAGVADPDALDFGDARRVGDGAKTDLVLEPLRYARELHPRAIALEQVPAVLPIWEAIGLQLTALGYSVATGILSAEQYGVPQTRDRAILVARVDTQVALPAPTHSRFYGRWPDRLDYPLEPPVAQSKACGWSDADLIGFPRRADKQGSTIELRGVQYRARDLRAGWNPSFTITEKARSWSRWPLGEKPVPVTLEQAAALQSFPPNYPWQGTRSSQFHQVGNAVPPGLARAVLQQLIG